MTTINQPLTAPEDKPNKTAVFFTALALAALMVSATAGGAAFMIYHEFTAMPEGSRMAAHPGKLSAPSFRQSSDDGQAGTVPMIRPVAAESSDRSDYRYADNTVLPPAEARRVIAAWTSNPVLPRDPAPLAKADDSESADTDGRPPLTDSGSHYIVSERTGQVIGVDGSAGAAVEARRAQAMPVATAIPVAVQTPVPEVRVASAVQVRAAIPVNPDGSDYTNAQDPVATDGAQYVPVRRAQPVTTARSFDAASYLAREDDASMPRAQAVVPTARAVSPRREFRLPDLSSQY